jgi:hypothetical protein
MKACYQHTDLEWRLSQIPDTAACRGVFLNMLDDRAAGLGVEVQRAYRDFFKTYKFSPLQFFPVKDYLIRIVKLAEIAFGAENIYRGIYEIQSHAFPAWRHTLIGRVWFAIKGNDLEPMLRMVCKNTPKVTNYGATEFTGSGGQFQIHFRNEYLYIEHAMAGALAGVAKACEVPVTIEVQLIDAFNGSVAITEIHDSAALSP